MLRSHCQSWGEAYTRRTTCFSQRETRPTGRKGVFETRANGKSVRRCAQEGNNDGQIEAGELTRGARIESG